MLLLEGCLVIWTSQSLSLRLLQGLPGLPHCLSTSRNECSGRFTLLLGTELKGLDELLVGLGHDIHLTTEGCHHKRDIDCSVDVRIHSYDMLPSGLPIRQSDPQ